MIICTGTAINTAVLVSKPLTYYQTFRQTQTSRLKPVTGSLLLLAYVHWVPLVSLTILLHIGRERDKKFHRFTNTYQLLLLLLGSLITEAISWK